jgi:anti-sigma regulatory factor (Ser/Thr protein kinase)
MLGLSTFFVSFGGLHSGYARFMEHEPVLTGKSVPQAMAADACSDPVITVGDTTSDFQTIGYEEFTPNVASIAEVRRFVRGLLEQHGLKEESVAACELVADELATNALTHTGSFYSVVVEQSEASVRIGVRDDSRILPVLRENTVGSESGRGLHIVSETSSHWGTESLGLGKETWADVETGCDGI